MKTKSKKILAVLALVFLCLNFVPTVYAAKKGDLDLNTHAIYENGNNKQKNQKDYDVPDLFLQDKSEHDHQVKQQQNNQVRKAEQSVFLRITKKHNYQSEDEATINKYLFTKNFTGAKAAGIESRQLSWWQVNGKYFWIAFLILVVLVLGILLGIKFPKLFSNFKQNMAESKHGK